MSPQSREHSRSPRRSGPEVEQLRRISKALVRFGRYPEACPKGLQPDAQGAFRLHDIEKVWGRGKGFSANDILRGVRAHMLNEEGGHLRFSIGEDRDGEIVIRIMPKRHRTGGKEAEWRGEKALVVATPQSTTEKLDLSLEDLIHVERFREVQTRGPQHFFIGSRSDGETDRQSDGVLCAAPRQRRRPTLRGSIAVSLAGDQAQALVRVSPETGRGGDQRRDADKVQRWLSWALKVGHTKLGLDLAGDSSARLDDIAKVMAESRPSLGKFTGKELGRFIEAEDRAGRFIVSSNGTLKKVPRGLRLPRRHLQQRRALAEGFHFPDAGLAGRAAPTPGASASASGARADRSPSPGSSSCASTARPRRGPARLRDEARAAVVASDAAAAGARRRSRSRSVTPGEDTDDSDLAVRCGQLQVGAKASEDQVLAERCGQALQVGAAASEASGDRQGDPQATRDSSPRPPLPPGPHWTQYQDQGLTWWGYDGPLGKFAYAEGQQRPEPYKEESE